MEWDALMPAARLLRILHAGSLDRLVRDDLIWLFGRRAAWRCESTSGGSRALARAIRDGSARADVFLSADAEVIEAELMGEANRSVVDAYVVFATNAMVVALSDAGVHASLARKALAGELGVIELLQAGLRIGRPDPEEDPKGYRTIFAIQLLERYVATPGLAVRVLGAPRNPEQIFAVPALVPMLRRGEIELLVTYRSQAVEEGLPFLELPAEASLESPDLPHHYAKASYRCVDGTAYRASAISYAAASVKGGADARLEFVEFLGTEEARQAMLRHGFAPAWRVVSTG